MSNLLLKVVFIFVLTLMTVRCLHYEDLELSENNDSMELLKELISQTQNMEFDESSISNENFLSENKSDPDIKRSIEEMITSKG